MQDETAVFRRGFVSLSLFRVASSAYVDSWIANPGIGMSYPFSTAGATSAPSIHFTRTEALSFSGSSEASG
jgi:hypothetical protein